MSESQLYSAYRRSITPDSDAFGNFPKEIKVCEITEPLCNDYIKLRNYYMALPYNFMMGNSDWSSVKNTVELATAIRFGMEWDMNKQADIALTDPAFHTQMYIRFHKYLMQKVMYDATQLVAEFHSAAFTARFLSTYAFDDLKELRNVETKREFIKKSYEQAKKLKEQIDKLNPTRASIDMALINENTGPLHINREMFIKLFKQDYNPKMVQILKNEGVYLGDSKNVQFNQVNKNSR